MIGDRIRALRRARGWRQKDLATRAGVTPGMIGHIETGEKEGSISTLQAIAGAFAISPGLLIDERVDVDHLVEISAILDGAQHLEPHQLEVILQMISALRSA